MHVLAKILYLAGMCEFDVFNCDFTVVYKTMLRTRLLCVCVWVCRNLMSGLLSQICH